MSDIFISHSSQDAGLALDVAKALQGSDYDSVFLDFDERHGIMAFEDWERVLYRKLWATRAVVAICTDHFLASKWCFAEIAIARALGKPVLPVAGEPLEEGAIGKLPGLLAFRQIVDLRTETEARLARISPALARLGLEPSLGAWNPARCPYPGLVAYGEKHASVFAGRNIDIVRGLELLRRVWTSRNDRFITVVGASGTGKSSLVRAGILPRLRTMEDQPWVVVSMRPFRAGVVAVAELADTLSEVFGGEAPKIRQKLEEPGGQLAPLLRDLRRGSEHSEAVTLIVLDQFEECLGGDEHSEVFLRLIVDALKRDEDVAVLATLRSDFLSTMQAHPILASIGKRWLQLEPMGRDGLVEVLREPARLAEARLEDALVERMLDDAGDGRALPLLAFTLNRLWEIGITAEDRFLQLKEYESIGGIRGAVATWARECVPDDTKAEELEALRAAFQALVQIDAQGRYRRRRARWQALDPKAYRLLERLINGRLLVSNDSDGERVIEVAHESLFEAWDRLRSWLSEDHHLLVFRGELSDAAAVWMRNNEIKDDLWRGYRLEFARENFESGRMRLGDDERRFLEVSLAEAERLRLAEELQRSERIRMATVSLSRALAIQARDELRQYPQRALALAVEAVLVSRNEDLPVTPQAESGLRDVLSQLGGRVYRGAASAANILSVAPDQKRLAAGYADGTVGVWPLERGQPSGSFLPLGKHDGEVHRLAWHRGLLFSSGEDGVVMRWAPEELASKPLLLQGHAKRLNRLAIDPKGRWLVVASDKDLFVWSLTEESEPVKLAGHEDAIRALVFNSTAELLLTSDFAGNLLAWSTAGPSIGPAHGTWQDKGDRIESIAFDPQTRFFVTGGLAGVQLWRFNQENGANKIELRELSGLMEYVTRVRIDKGGNIIVAETYSGRTACWLADDGFTVPVQLDGGDARLPLSPFHPDGSFFLTCGRKQPRVSVWHIASLREAARPTILRGDDTVRPALFLPNGNAAAADGNGTLRTWTSSYAQPEIAFAPTNGLDLNRCAISREASVVVAAGDRLTRGRDLDRRAKLVDAASGEAVIFDPFEKGVDHVALSADGMLVALCGDRDEGAIEVRRRNGAARRIAVTDKVQCLDLSPDGHFLAAGNDTFVRLWDLTRDTDEPLFSESLKDRMVELHFDAGGANLVGSDREGTVHVWEVMANELRLRKSISMEGGQDMVDLSADGGTLVALGGKSLRLVRLDEKPDTMIKFELGPVQPLLVRASFAINADATRIVVATDGSRVARYYDLTENETNPTPVDLRGHDDGIWDVAMTEDGQRIATVGKDGTMRLWSTETAESVVLSVPLGPAWRVAFRAGRVLAASNEGLCRWLLDIDDLIVLAGRTASRNLTASEWARFLPGPPRETFEGLGIADN